MALKEMKRGGTLRRRAVPCHRHTPRKAAIAQKMANPAVIDPDSRLMEKFFSGNVAVLHDGRKNKVFTASLLPRKKKEKELKWIRYRH